jgi:hypothetical protein
MFTVLIMNMFYFLAYMIAKCGELRFGEVNTDEQRRQGLSIKSINLRVRDFATAEIANLLLDWTSAMIPPPEGKRSAFRAIISEVNDWSCNRVVVEVNEEGLGALKGEWYPRMDKKYLNEIEKGRKKWNYTDYTIDDWK